MNKSKLAERRTYVKKNVWKAKNSTKAIEKIAKKLFLSPSTIWKDLLSD